MRSLIRGLCAFALTVVIVGVVSAEEKKPGSPFAKMFTFPAKIKASEDQQKKLDELQKEYTPKLEEIVKKMDTIMTPERKKIAKEAGDKAKADGKKGKEVAEAVDAALKLSQEDKDSLKEIAASRKKLDTEIKTKVTALMTDEQKEALKPKPKT